MSAVDEIDYLEEAGPGIAELPEAPEVAPASEELAAPAALPGWDQKTIETFLQGTGAGIHMLAGRAERDWMMTEKDLERIAPPLTRICNRYEPTLRLSPLADPLLVAHGFALYGWRSALEAKRAERDVDEDLEAGPRYETGPVEDAGAVDLGEDLDEAPPPYFPNGDANEQ